MNPIPLHQAAVLGAAQGLTELLPVSSSAHLILIPWLLRWQDPGLSYDVALHLGTLAALVAYFFRDWRRLFSGALRNPRSVEGRLLVYIGIATLPGGAAGLLLEKAAETYLRSPLLIAGTTMAFALWLGAAERRGRQAKTLEQIGLADALWIGAGQAMALFPGVSRSGVTITAGLLEGLDKEAAARFSFLLATPIMLGAGLHKLRHVPARDLGAPFFTGVACSALVGLLAIRLLMTQLRRFGFRPYVWYRLAAGVFVVCFYFWRGS